MRPIALAAAVQAAVPLASAPAWAQGATGAPQQRAPQDLVARGQQLFEDQQYEESIQTLSAALLRPSNTPAQKIEIYRLLALNYITLNRKDEAESAVRGLLALNPAYALPATESPRFRDFFDAVRKKWEDEGRPGLVKETEPPPAPVAMRHSSPSQADPGTQINLTATLDDPGKRVTSVKLFYRTGSKGKFETSDAHLDGRSVRASIPGSSVSPPLVEYYFQGFDKGGLPIVSRGDAGAPLRVAVPEPSNGWVLPVVITGGALLVAGAITAAVLASKGSTSPPNNPNNPPNNPPGNSQVVVTIGSSSVRW